MVFEPDEAAGELLDELDFEEAAELELLLEPQAATPNDAATTKAAALMRRNRTIISFGCGSSV